ncbi:hypothetical protein [Prevotella disiens]|uniref:hypothetical protein n=1 Tax=Prevotella disiens TaxID=28130 RepID=UPI001FD59031|nr:hypothetical protein [Prevotella disiens]
MREVTASPYPPIDKRERALASFFTLPSSSLLSLFTVDSVPLFVVAFSSAKAEE